MIFIESLLNLFQVCKCGLHSSVGPQYIGKKAGIAIVHGCFETMQS